MRHQSIGLAFLLLSSAWLAGCRSDVQLTPSPQTPTRVERSRSYGRGVPYEQRYPEEANSVGGGGGGRSHGRSQRRQRGTDGAVPGTFDFYLLTLSWSPAFCATHPASDECGSHPGFVVHGLWPQNNDGSWPQHCSDAAGPADPQRYVGLLPAESLVEHEWQTHGTCTGIAPDAYFDLVRRAADAVRIPPSFAGSTQPQPLTPAALLAQFAQQNPHIGVDSLRLSCGNNTLTAVEVCLTKALQPQPCPAVRSCGATVISVIAR